MKAGRAKDIHKARPYLKVAVVGASGSGKTFWGARSPRPLIISTEPQSIVTAVDANPEAFVVAVESWADFREIWNMVKLAVQTEIEVTREDGTVEIQPACAIEIEGETIVFQTVVVDSFTDLQRMMLGKLAGTEDGTRDRLDFEGGAVNLTIEKWGMLTSACETVWSQQRSLACNTIFLFVAMEQEDDQKVKTTLPMLSGSKLPFSMGQYFNAVGLQRVTRGAAGGLAYMTQFAVPSAKGIAKPAPGWPSHVKHTMEPGHTTLGSLLRFSHPTMTVASEVHDDAKYVTGPAAEVPAQDAPAAAQTPSRRRRG